MNFKKIIPIGFLFIFLVPIVNVSAIYSYSDYIKNGNYAFFLIDLEEGHNIQLDLSHEENGDFNLLLFNKRPTKSNVNNDNTLNTDIIDKPSTIAYDIESNYPSINYTATETDIYYIEVILVDGGPDTFTLKSKIIYSNNNTEIHKDLTRYYLPIVPGFQLEILIPIIIFSFGISILFYKKKKK